jgi:hypothetical protein
MRFQAETLLIPNASQYTANVSLVVRILRFVRDNGPVTTAQVARSTRPRPGPGREVPTSALAHSEPHVSRYLDELRELGLVEEDCAPDRWVATPRLSRLQQVLDLSLTGLLSLEPRDPRVQSELLAVTSRLEERVPPESPYRENLLETLKEISVCLDHQCWMAVMSLAGKVLEVCIKQRMVERGLPFQEDWMLGTLLTKIKAAGESHIGSAISNVANIINESRITAVHAKVATPTPTEAQAMLVVHAMFEVIDRTLLRRPNSRK